MPREIVHWKVLEHAAVELAESAPQISRCLEIHGAAAQFGAVVHDAPFYLKSGTHPFRRTAQLLHGTYGGDTFAPIRRALFAAAAYPERDRPLLWAFLIGMISHAATDRIFHPMVYYFTGNYYDADSGRRIAARVRHRILEVYLDSWARRGYELPNAFLIGKTEEELGETAELIYSFLDTVLTPAVLEDVPNSMVEPFQLELGDELRHPYLWKQSMDDMIRFQRMFLSPSYGVLAKVLRTVLPSRFAPIEALFSLGRTRPEPLFDERLEFCNPITGEEHSLSPDELLQLAAQETVRLALLCEPLISGNHAEAEARLSAERGKSLDFNLTDDQIGEIVYFSNAGLPLPGLQQI